MGATRFSGPVYGAKQTLFSCSKQDVSSGAGSGLAGIVIAGTVVPSGEDWYATEFTVYRGSTGSTSLGLAVLDDSSVVSSATITSSLAAAKQQNIIAADAGEYEGTRILSGSVVEFSLSQSSAVGASSNVTVQLSGYRRFISSTRAE